MSRFTEKLPWVVLATVGGMVLSIGISTMLQNVLPLPMRQGIAFWVLMISLFPMIVYLSQRDRQRKYMPPKFRRHLVIATAGAVVVGLLSTLI